MQRRNFLKLFGTAGITAAVAPKIIFDMGANLYRIAPQPIAINQILVIGTPFSHADPLMNKMWAERLLADINKESYFNRFMVAQAAGVEDQIDQQILNEKFYRGLTW